MVKQPLKKFWSRFYELKFMKLGLMMMFMLMTVFVSMTMLMGMFMTVVMFVIMVMMMVMFSCMSFSIFNSFNHIFQSFAFF